MFFQYGNAIHLILNILHLILITTFGTIINLQYSIQLREEHMLPFVAIVYWEEKQATI